MYANFVEVTVDLSADPELKGLHEGIIPRVRQLPGFVAGYWLEPIVGKGMSVVVYRDEASARGAIDTMSLKVGESPTPGITIERLETREVIGHA